jgi:hypothetical protein
MQRFARIASLVAVALLITLGVWHAAHPTPPGEREPQLSATLKPLINLPIPAGSEVLFAFPHAADAERPLTPLFEAAWLRPDLRFAVWQGEGAATGFDYLVSIDIWVAPPKWREVWRQGGVVLYRRSSS